MNIILILLLLTVNVYAAAPQRQNTYVPNSAITAADVTSNENVIFNYLQAGVDTYADNSIFNADVASNANIQSDKLNLTSIAQNITNSGTFANTGNATVTGTLTVSSTATVNGVVNATLPAGVMMAWGTTSAPTGWLLCDGTAVSRSTYSGLYAVIGTTFGTGDGSTTFNLPNTKGKNIIGLNSSDTSFDTMGETGGAKTHTLDATEMPSHSHSIATEQANSFGTVKIANTATGTGNAATISTATAGSGAAHTILDPYITLNYIIKY